MDTQKEITSVLELPMERQLELVELQGYSSHEAWVAHHEAWVAHHKGARARVREFLKRCKSSPPMSEETARNFKAKIDSSVPPE